MTRSCRKRDFFSTGLDSRDGFSGRPRRAPHAPRRVGRLGHDVEPGARAGHRAAGQGLLGVRPPRHRLRPARRAEPRRARRDLPLDGADPVEPDRGRALRARRDRRGLPLAGHHDARAALQPDEAKPRRRARPRPHHPRRHPRPRRRRARIPAGPGRPDPDDGPDVHRAAERDRRREGDPLGVARDRRRRHRRAAAARRALSVPQPGAARRGGPFGRPRRDHPRRRGRRRPGRRGDRRGGRDAPARPHRPRDPGRALDPS